MKFVLALFILLFGLTGCHFKESFQPPRENFETWIKPEASKLGIMKSMLECGEAPIAERNASVNTVLLADWCMESLGYKSDVITMKEICELEDYKQYPACQTGAVIPKPSVERRLNSEYCRYARSLIDPVELDKCFAEVKHLKKENLTTNMTEDTCVYYYKDLREECRL